ncbi:MAG: hypothetical protein QM761_03235 [Pseudoxanthomonas sp.]
MPAHSIAPMTPYLATAGIAWLYYRRIRRHFGRQEWRPIRTAVRIALLSLVAAMLALAAIFLPHVAWGMAGGGVAGAALGLLSLRHTHAEWADGRGWYTPNPWIGGALSVLLVGRLAWRWSQGAFSSGAGQTLQQASPLTLAIAAALVAYSLVNGVGLLLRMRRLAAATGAKRG